MFKRILVKILKLCCLASSATVFYVTLRQHMKRRKYRHIPGPKTKGYCFLVFNVLISKYFFGIEI